MFEASLRNVAIIFRHEYWQRIRTRSFIVTTLLMPAFMAMIVSIPTFATSHQTHRRQHLVLVCANPDLAALISESIARGTGNQYQSTTDTDLSGDERRQLVAALNAGRIDGYLWMDAAAIATGKVSFARVRSGDFIGQQLVRSAISSALTRYRLAQLGMTKAEAGRLLRGVQLDSITVGSGVEIHDAGIGGMVTVFIFVLVLFITLLSYGVTVMRSVLDEKASRVMEILLCSATAEDLMSGKILGVGAVGLTQVIVWGVLGLLIAAPGAGFTHTALVIPFSYIVYFAIFYLLGYLLYSAMFAAVGAAFNSTDEAQQWTFVIISPLIVASTLMTPIASAPNSTLATIASMIPFCAPVLMYLRIVVQRPPAWQIALCIAILLASIYFALQVCARVYRVGILMYGKRPGVREIFKWLRYA